MQPMILLRKLILFLLSFTLIMLAVSLQSQSEIGGYVYDYYLQKIERVQENTFIITDVNGDNVDYTSCPNPSSNPDLSFNLCLNNFNDNQLPVQLSLNKNNKYAGRTVKDLILIKMHLYGMKEFTNYHEYVAGDLNCNSSNSTADISFFRKYLLGKEVVNRCDKLILTPYDTLLKKEDFWDQNWRDTVFSIQSVPFYNLKTIPYYHGDVNGSVFSKNPDAELVLDVSIHDSVAMHLPNHDLIEGNEYDIWISTIEIDILGFQMGFTYDTNYIENLAFDSKSIENVKGYYHVYDNQARIVYNSREIETEKIKGKWLNLKFTALKDGKLSDAFLGEVKELSHRVVMGDLSVRPIKFVFEAPSKANDKINPSIGLIVSPNPSSEDVRINMTIPQGITQGIFSIYNSLGKLVSKTAITNINESHQLIIPKDKFPNTGLYIGTLETEKGRQIVEILRL